LTSTTHDATILRVTGLAEGGGKPLQTLVKTISRSSASRLNVLGESLAIAANKKSEYIGLTQARCLKLWRPSLSVISAAFIAFCYMINTTKLQSKRGIKTYGQILLVGKDQKNGIPELILVEHALQFLTGLDNTVTIVAVNNEDDTLGILEVVSPEGTDLVLTTDIPHGELNVLVLDSLNVEPCCEVPRG
jgi:hypothetical protein